MDVYEIKTGVNKKGISNNFPSNKDQMSTLRKQISERPLVDV